MPKTRAKQKSSGGERRSSVGRLPPAAASDRQVRALRTANEKLGTQLRDLRRKHTELEKSRDHYSELFDLAPVGYMLLDHVGLILNINKAAARLLKVQRRHLIGHPLMTFAIDVDRREVLEHMRRCRAGHSVVESEVRFPGAEGKSVTCRLYTQRSAWHERHEVFPTAIVDQSDHLAIDEARLSADRRRQVAERDAKAALGASAMKDRFLAVVSHELRTPLTPALFAASRLVGSNGLSDDARKLALAIKRNIEFEARLIDDLLDVARINQDRLDLQSESLDIHEVLREAVATCRTFAHQYHLNIHVHLSAEEHYVKGDRGRLRQVFWNLLNNAIKFSDTGGGITVASANWPGSSRVHLTIRDEGAGIDPALLATLFAPFERKPVHHGSRSGLGLGLAICKGIVAAHRGQISASSEGPGCGSTFTVELATVPPVPQQQKPVDIPVMRTSFESLRVLIVEDDRDSRDMLSLFLSGEGCDVAVAPTLADGLRKLDYQWDVVLSDIGLPDGSGLEVARQARRLERPPKRLIALTGYGSSDDIKATRDAGFHAHVVKPIDLDQLLATLGGHNAVMAIRSNAVVNE
jgi:PAS domain S-box-containing protein